MSDKISDDELRKLALDYHRLTDGGTCRLMATPVNHAGQLARRLLELLPAADDAEPVTADWLKAVGFVFEDELYILEQEIGYDCHVIGLSTEDLKVWEIYDSLGSGQNVVTAFALPTRGHVRRLALALGITLTGPKS